MRIDLNSKLGYWLPASREGAENKQPHRIENGSQDPFTRGSSAWMVSAFIRRCGSAFRTYRFLLLLDKRANEAARVSEMIEEALLSDHPKSDQA